MEIMFAGVPLRRYVCILGSEYHQHFTALWDFMPQRIIARYMRIQHPESSAAKLEYKGEMICVNPVGRVSDERPKWISHDHFLQHFDARLFKLGRDVH
ncbi:hypothetical protein D3C84_804850 [compost metagenome]